MPPKGRHWRTDVETLENKAEEKEYKLIEELTDVMKEKAISNAKQMAIDVRKSYNLMFNCSNG